MDQNLSISSVPAKNAIHWLLDGWEATKKHYPLALGVGLLLIIVPIIINQAPLIGPILTSILYPFLMPGYAYLGKKIVEDDHPQFEDILIGFKDRDLIYQIILYIVIFAASFVTLLILILLAALAAGALFQIDFAMLKSDPSLSIPLIIAVVGILIIAFMVFTIATVFAFPLMTFKKIGFIQTIPLSLKAATANILPLTLLAFLVGILYILGIVMIFIPLIFVLTPMSFSVVYLTYASIFEGRTLKVSPSPEPSP